MSNKRILIILLIVFIIVLVIVLPRFLTGNGEQPTETAANDRQGIPVEAIVAESRELQNRIFATGSILPNESVTLTSEVSGRITQLNIEEGAAVRQGTLLVKINDSELQAELRKLNANIKLAGERVERLTALLEAEGVSKEAYDEAVNQKESLEADRDNILSQIEKTEIRAPFDGIIGLRYISPGAFVSSNTEIANLVSISPLKIEFSVPERFAYMVDIDDRISFKVSGLDTSFTASVYAYEPSINLSTRTLSVRAITKENNMNILPGSFADVELILSEDPEAIVIPTQSLIPELAGHHVYVHRNGKVHKTNVDIGIRKSEIVEIINGLQAGDTVITTGLLQVSDQAEVTVEIVSYD